MQIFEQASQALATLGPCVATIGKYDGMHLGHQHILRALQAEAGRLRLPSVVILSEPQPEEFFAPDTAPPRLNHFQDKVDFLRDFGIDAVLRMRFDISLSRMPAESFVREFLARDLGLRSLVVGHDFRFGWQRQGDFALLQQLGAELGFSASQVAPLHEAGERVSSTLVRNTLQAGDCAKARRLLARPYMISGEVVLGRQLGRQLGTPTANLALQAASLPMRGVFAVNAEVQGTLLPGVANLGYKPTVSEEPAPSLEVHLLDYAGDLYGQQMKVHFLHKLRDEIRFDGLDALKAQIAEDIQQAREFHAGPALEAGA